MGQSSDRVGISNLIFFQRWMIKSVQIRLTLRLGPPPIWKENLTHYTTLARRVGIEFCIKFFLYSIVRILHPLVAFYDSHGQERGW